MKIDATKGSIPAQACLRCSYANTCSTLAREIGSEFTKFKSELYWLSRKSQTRILIHYPPCSTPDSCANRGVAPIPALALHHNTDSPYPATPPQNPARFHPESSTSLRVAEPTRTDPPIGRGPVCHPTLIQESNNPSIHPAFPRRYQPDFGSVGSKTY
jgi:hypothetical protein